MTVSAKHILRERIRRALKLMTNEERVQQSVSITNILLHHPKYLAAKSISIFVHMNTEVSTREILQHALQFNKQIFIPRYSSTTMDMLRIYSLEDLDSLPMTKWNIRQPALDDNSREIATKDVDLIVVPGLAFSLDGSRLGHGKGFYDRYLSSLSENSYTIGLAYRQQIVENNVIPMNATDVRIDEILLAD